MSRREEIQVFLEDYFPTTCSNLISNYDSYIVNESYTFDCFPELVNKQEETWENLRDACINCICTLYDGRVAIGANNGVCKIFNINSQICEMEFIKFQGSIVCLTELPDHRLLIGFGIKITNLQIWNLKTGIYDTILKNNDTYFEQIVVVGTNLMGCGYNNRTLHFKVWNIDDGLIKETFTNTISRSETISYFSKLLSNGQALVITNHHKLILWNPKTRIKKVLSSSIYDHLNHVLYYNSSTIISYNNYKLEIWVHGKRKAIIKEGLLLYHIIKLPDQRILYITAIYEICIFDIRTYTHERSLGYMPTTSYITDIQVSTDGSIICSTQDGTISVLR